MFYKVIFIIRAGRPLPPLILPIVVTQFSCSSRRIIRLALRSVIPASKLVLELGYNIDYEDEKESFEVDEADTVELVNGERMPWEQVRRDGIDYIALYYVNEEGKQVRILDAELA